MPEQHDARHLLEWAEQAATAGDLASADELLRNAAEIQEQELGPHHPDLANTLNNLAIVAEKTERWTEAETFYRRAAAITASALAADDPMRVASRQNLEDFCRARGLSIDAPDVTPFRSENTVIAAKVAQPPPAAPVPTPSKASPSLQWVATGAIVLVVAALLMWRPWASRQTSREQSPAPAAAPPAEARPPATAATPTASGPIEKSAPPPPAPPRNDRSVLPNKAHAASGITVVAQLCRTFSTSGGNWRCDPAGDTAAPGRMAFYTRVKSPRNTVVVHRWYHGATLRQSVTLSIQASPTEGYRTYSRLTVDQGAWRLEVRSTDGDLLHEQRFTVR